MTVARALFFVVLCVPLLASSNTDPFMGGAVIDPPFTPLTYSIQTFLWWDPTQAALRLDWVRNMVFSHVKQTFAWEDIEPIEGEWHFERGDRILDEIERRDLKLIARLSDAPDWTHPSIVGSRGEDFLDAPPDNLDDYANFCRVVAERYAGRIAAYQIWNEPNLSREWGNRVPHAAGYVELLKSCSDAIRAADPGAIIISAGLSPTGNYDNTAIPDDVFLQQMYDAGFQRYVDVVGVHAPGYSKPDVSPDEAERSGSQRFFTFRRVEDLRKIMIRNGDAARQVAILEVGWTTDPNNPNYAWFAVTQDEQAANLQWAYQYAAENWRPWVGLMSVIYMGNPAWTQEDEEYWWSIITPEGWQLRAYVNLANMPKYCGDTYLPARDPGSQEAQGLVIVSNPCH